MQMTSRFAELARVGLMDVILLAGKKRPNLYSSIVTQKSTKQAYEQLGFIGDFGMAQAVGEGDSGNYDIRQRGGVKSYVPIMYRNGFTISKQAAFTDMYNAVKDPGRELARSMAHTKEQVVANAAFNNAFTGSAYAIWDGLAFFSMSHLLGDGVSTTSNRGDGTNELALSVLNAETAITQVMSQLSHRGNPAYSAGPFTCWVKPNLLPLATRIFETNKQQGTANNDNSFVYNYVTPKANPYITSTTAWHLFPNDGEQIVMIDQIPLFTEKDYDIDNLEWKMVTGESYVVGIKDFREYWATQGA